MTRQVLLAAVVTALVADTSAAAAPPPLPMIWRFYTPPVSNVRALGLSGRLPTTAAGQRVTILGRDCLSRFYRQVRVTQTVRGGGWEVELAGPYGRPGDLESGLTYRARWQGRWSVPFTYRDPMRPTIEKLSGGRVRVTIANGGPGYGGPLQSFARRPVVLQRATGSGWTDVQSARLALVHARTFTATFAVRTRGLTMRALVPTRTARPCFNAGASANFTS